MRRAHRHGGLAALALAALGLAACGGGADLTCELIADPDNCWADTAAAIRACLPAGAEPGVFAADRRSCTFADGARVEFDEALPQTTFDIGTDLDDLAMTFHDPSGAACARFVDTLENRIEISAVAGGRAAIAELHAGSDFHLHCGGTTYEAPFDALFDCAAEGVPPPTDGFDLTATEVALSISAVTTPGELFRCVAP